jgi:hypothetical protein
MSQTTTNYYYTGIGHTTGSEHVTTEQLIDIVNRNRHLFGVDEHGKKCPPIDPTNYTPEQLHAVVMFIGADSST